jgi:hypothetical protein
VNRGERLLFSIVTYVPFISCKHHLFIDLHVSTSLSASVSIVLVPSSAITAGDHHFYHIAF